MTGRWAKNRFDNDVGRRVFLKAAGTAAILAAAGTLGCASPAATQPAATQYPTTGAAVKTPRIGDLIVASDPDPVKAVDKALEGYGGLDGIVRPGDKVLLKANYTFARVQDMATANHPDVLTRIAQWCKEAGAAEVTVLDHTVDTGSVCLKQTGIGPALQAAGFTPICINDLSDFEEYPLPGKALKSTLVAKRLHDADVFINAPVIKSHNNTLVSASMKNLMGLIWERGIFHSENMDRYIADLAWLLRPDLIIADAFQVLKTGGPGSRGEIIYPREVIVGTDPVAIDAYGGSMIGGVPEDIGHIKLAAEDGLGRIDPVKAGLTRV